ncbi:MAG: PEP-CTERM sorting domain-containing protein [Kiritimatiellae bacterium]|jgi:hypothetical protein|nr:PEP-CTERM sorting domain-containing protein [Kiritimatiellia bacterium]
MTLHSFIHRTTVLLVSVLFAGGFSARATDYIWGGGDLPYTDTSASGWNGGPPNLHNGGDTGTVNSGTVTYTPGADFSIAGGNTLTISGSGLFTQSGGGSWMNIGNSPGAGNLIVQSGGEFNMGTAGRMRLGYWGTDSLVQIDGGIFDSDGALVQVGQSDSNNAAMSITGSATVTLAAVEVYNLLEANGGNVSYSSLNFLGSKGGTFSIGGSGVNGAGNLSVGSGYTFSMNSGSLSLTGEFQASGGDSSVSGGALNTSLLSLSGDVFDFSGGNINLDGTSSEGISADGAGDYLNFTLGSTGTLFVDNLDSTGLDSLLNSGRVRADGVTDSLLFNSTAQGDGYAITVIPEPSALLLISIALLPGIALLRRRFR